MIACLFEKNCPNEEFCKMKVFFNVLQTTATTKSKINKGKDKTLFFYFFQSTKLKCFFFYNMAPHHTYSLY